MAGERRPLIAGNWKMHKTEERGRGVHPSPVAWSVGGQRGQHRDLRAVHRPAAMVDSARGSRVEVYAQNMHHEPEGAFTGEISAPMLAELDVPASCSATPSGASCSARPTGRSR